MSTESTEPEFREMLVRITYRVPAAVNPDDHNVAVARREYLEEVERRIRTGIVLMGGGHQVREGTGWGVTEVQQYNPAASVHPYGKRS